MQTSAEGERHKGESDPQDEHGGGVLREATILVLINTCLRKPCNPICDYFYFGTRKTNIRHKVKKDFDTLACISGKMCPLKSLARFK